MSDNMDDRIDALRNATQSQEATNNQNVLKQGKTYNPTTSSNRGIRNSVNNSSNDEGNNTEPKKKNKAMLIIVGILVVIVGIIFTVVYMKINNKEEKPKDPVNAGSSDVEYEPPFEYTSIETMMLRNAGYTGTEIEEYQSQEVDVNYLIEEAERAREEWAAQFIAPYYDTASEEYKDNLYNTWLSLPLRDDISNFSNIGSEYTTTKNLSYEKVPIHGSQIFIKVYLDIINRDNYFFMQVSPERFLELQDTGNIVVTYTYVHSIEENEGYTSEDTSSMLILNAYEVIVEY